MPIGSHRLVPRATGVSMLNVENSWASQVLASATTNIKDMARFQQRQLAEKEQKLLQLYDQQQLRAHQVAQRGSAGSNGSNSSGHGNTSHHQTVTRTSTTTHATSNSQGGGGKVRQMFDERRQTTVKGIDKSYPLEPLENRSRKHQTTTTSSNVTVNSTSQLKNGNPTSNRRSVVTRRTVRSEASSNVNDGKPVVTYQEEVSREISDSNDRDNEREEFGDDNFHVSRYENGNRRVDRPNQLEIEDVTNDNTAQRHRTTAKIHLAEFDRSNVTNIENEQLSNEEINIPEKLPGRSSIGRKSFQSETKLERPKNSNVKKAGQPIKQVAGNTTSFTKKRNDSSALSGSSSRASTVTIRMEGEISRGRSTSPELEGSKKSRTSSPEVSENKGKLMNPATCPSPIIKTTGVTRVSQLSHKNTTDFYPRRKSEFEKSKTFRKLQLELGESSPEPNEPEDLPPSVFSTQCRKRSSIINENIYSSGRRSPASSSVYDKIYSKEGKSSHETSPERPQSRRESQQSSSYRRESLTNSEEKNISKEEFKTSSLESNTYSSKRRSSSSSPVIDHGFSNGRKESPEKSPKRPESQKRFSSPTFRRKSTSKNEDNKTSNEEMKTSTFDSSTFFSKHHSTSWNPTGNRDYSKERKESQERSGSLERSQSPNYSRKSIESKEDRKTSKEEIRKTSFDSSTNYLRRRSSSSNPYAEYDLLQERRKSHEKSPERPESRGGFTTPYYRRDSLTNRDERKTKSNYESSTFASRLRSGSPILIVDYDLSEERSAIYEVSQNRPASRGRSQSPISRRESIMERDEKMYEDDSKHFASSTYSSRQHSASPVPPVDHDYSEDKKTSHEISHDTPRSRERSQSPTHRRASIIEHDERSTRKDSTNFASSTYASRQHATYPTSSADHEHPEDRKTSHRVSHEGPGSRERSQSPTYYRESFIEHDQRSTEKDTNFAAPTFSSRQHAAYPTSSAEDEYSEERRMSHSISHERPESRERSQSPTYRRQSLIEHDQRSTEKETNFASPTFSSRQHAAYLSSSAKDEYSEDRKTSHRVSHERPESRERSQSPTYRRQSLIEHDQRSTEKDTNFASPTFSSRQHAAYPTPSAEDEYSEDRKTSHRVSHEGPGSRERSQSPTYRRQSFIEHDQRSTEKDTNFASPTFSSRQHAAYPTSSAEDEYSEDRRTSHSISHERPESRERSQSPTYRRQSFIEHDQRSTEKDTNFASPTFSSRQHAAYLSSSAKDEYSEDRKTSHTMSHQGPGSRERSQSPVNPRKSIIDNDQLLYGKDATFDSPTFSSRQHATYPTASAEDDYSQNRVTSHAMSHEGRDSRERSQSPTYRRDLITEHDERSTKKDTASFATSTFSSRQHSDYATSSIDRNCSEDRKTSYTIPHEGPRSRERSQSPSFRRESYVQDLDTAHAASGETKTYEASTFSSRCHSTFPASTVDCDFSSQGSASREKSPEYPSSRRGSQSPIHRRESIVKNDDKIASSTFASSTYSSRRRSSSSSPILDNEITKERESSHDRDYLILEKRRKPGENLRSFELIKKIVGPASPEKKTNITSTKKSTNRKTTLEDIEISTESSNQHETTKRPRSLEHKIVKKDKAPTKITKQEKRVKTKETNTRDSRSRTISPSSVTATKNTSTFKARNNECKTFGNKRIETKIQQKLKDTNSIKEKDIKKNNSVNSRSSDVKDSRRSSSEITVKRHDTFKVAKPNENIVSIDTDKINKEKITLDKKNRDAEFKDKSQLLERIEKIRSTLSRSGRSEQNLRSSGFERTDSVESALKRFDSIGVETEHRVTVGVDEPDRVSPKAKSQIFYSTDVKKIPVTEEIIVKKTIAPLCRPAKTTVAVVKAQPRPIDAESPTLAARETEILKSGKTKREKSVTNVTTPRNSDKKMLSKSHEAQKRVTSMVKKSRLRSEEPSGRGEGRQMDSSPICKRKLFEDSESEIENENVRSTIVLTATTRVTNNSPIIMEIETKKNRESVRQSAINVLQMESSFGESKMENEPAKILRSIEDIRKSIKRESQDFKRELNKFNKAMRRNSSTKDNPDSIMTSGTVSCVQITKTFKSGDRQPVVKIEKSIVKLPITHRVAKSPSPDIGTKRTMEAKTKSTANNVVRRSVPSSPARMADTSNRCGSSELRVSGTKSSMRTSSSPGSRETKNQKEYSITTEYTDVDGPQNGCEIAETEIIQTATTRKSNDAFVTDFDDTEFSENKKSASNREELSVGKRPSERTLTSQRQYGSATISTSSRPTSALSTTSSATSARGQISQINSKSKMSTKAKSPSSDGPRGPSSNPRTAPPATDANDGLVSCKICSRRFNSDRIARHEQICSKTTTKKRKQFDATTHRVKGTELEQFVKKGASRKSQADRKTQKPEVKSNWRRKHEDFINAIRSAKQVSAHLAAGGKLSDLPPPPPSDTSDYVQCPHCGRKFNQGAADRHIPKCQTMMHNKPNSRAPPKPKR